MKRWFLKICPFSPQRHGNWVFWTPVSLQTTRERKEKGGERGEKKKGLLALIIFILPTLEIVSERQKSARDTPLGHLSRAVPFSKIRVRKLGFLDSHAYKPHGREKRRETHNFYIAHFGDSFWTTKKCSRHTARQKSGYILAWNGLKWPRNAEKARSARIRSFFTIWQHLLQTTRNIYSGIVSERQKSENRDILERYRFPNRFAHFHRICLRHGNWVFWTPMSLLSRTTVFKNPGIYWHEMG